MEFGVGRHNLSTIGMRMILSALIFVVPTIASAQSSTSGKSGLPLPRFASLKSGKVNVRVGPGTDFKINWLYKKRGLPMEIIQEFDNWRKVRDPQGNEGWVLHSLLSGRRTVVIRPWESDQQAGLADLRDKPATSASLSARLQAGVVATVQSCSDAWCQLEVKDADGKTIEGYVEKNALWGVYPDEFIEE